MLMKRLEQHKDINVNGDLAMVEINNNKKDSLHSTGRIQIMAAQDEIEPSIVLAHLKEKFPELYDDCEKVVLAGKSRREQAEKLLEYFKKLNGKSFSDIKNSIFTQKGISGKQQNAHNNERLKRKDLMKTIIKNNWDFLLEEVDSITISDTFESQKTDDKWQNVWQNYVGKARKDKNELFLNYIYENEEWLLPFDDVLRKQNLSLPCIMPCSRVTC